MKTLLVVLSLTLLVVPRAAFAQCKSDNDCKGDRICESGRCVDAVESTSYVAPAPKTYVPRQRTQVVQVAEVPDPGWAVPGAVIGIAGGIITLSLAMVAANEVDDGGDGTDMGAAAVGIAIPASIIAGLGSASVDGIDSSIGLPLRITGWIGMGLVLADAAYLLSQDESTPELATATRAAGLLGALSLTALSLDGIFRASAARDALAELEAPSSARPAVVPGLALMRDSKGSKVPALSLAMTF